MRLMDKFFFFFKQLLAFLYRCTTNLCWEMSARSLDPQVAETVFDVAKEPEDKVVPSLSQEEEEERNAEEQRFYERLLSLTSRDDIEEIDGADYNFLTDFAICNITLTVYRELQANRFFNQTLESDPKKSAGLEEEDLQESGAYGR